MYKVLLVDDEYYILQRLKTCISWENYGFQIFDIAQNAADALALLSEKIYDLAVIDISMPKKDGLTLISEIKQNNISVKIIILSGYANFEYAQRAIRYGVTEYLLKPINEEDLISSLHKISQILYTEQEIRQRNSDQFRTNYLLNNIKKENFFKKIFTNYPLLASDISSLSTSLSDYGLEEGTTAHIIVFDLQSKYFRNMPLTDIQLYQYAVGNVLHEILDNYFDITDASDIFNHGVFVCCISQKHSTDFLETIKQAAQNIKDSLHLDISIGCSSSFSVSLKELNFEYYHALTTYVLCNLRSISCLIYDTSKDISYTPDIARLLSKIDAHFLSGKSNSLLSSIDQLFECIEEQNYSFLSLDQILFKLITVCCTDINKRTPTALSESEELSFLLGYKELLFSGYNLDYIRERIKQLFLSLLSVQTIPAGTKNTLIADAVTFIQTHYSRSDINLALISKNLLISPSYLSTVFKKETGISISQYITKLRMEKSKEFLNNDQLTLTEVAERVGYRDSFYFSKVFKRYFGISPSAYRN